MRDNRWQAQTSPHQHIHSHICRYINTHTHTHTHTLAPTHTHTHTHTHTYTHTYTHTHILKTTRKIIVSRCRCRCWQCKCSRSWRGRRGESGGYSGCVYGRGWCSCCCCCRGTWALGHAHNGCTGERQRWSEQTNMQDTHTKRERYLVLSEHIEKDRQICRKRPIYLSKETQIFFKRDLYICRKRLIYVYMCMYIFYCLNISKETDVLCEDNERDEYIWCTVWR